MIYWEKMKEDISEIRSFISKYNFKNYQISQLYLSDYEYNEGMKSSIKSFFKLSEVNEILENERLIEGIPIITKNNIYFIKGNSNNIEEDYIINKIEYYKKQFNNSKNKLNNNKLPNHIIEEEVNKMNNFEKRWVNSTLAFLICI